MTKEQIYQDFLKLTEKSKKAQVDLYNLYPELFNEDEKWAIEKYLNLMYVQDSIELVDE